MQLRILFFCLFGAFSFSLSAQQIMVSDELPLRSDIGYEIIGELGDDVLLFRDKSVTFEVQAFDENMRSYPGDCFFLYSDQLCHWRGMTINRSMRFMLRNLNQSR